MLYNADQWYVFYCFIISLPATTYEPDGNTESLKGSSSPQMIDRMHRAQSYFHLVSLFYHRPRKHFNIFRPRKILMLLIANTARSTN